MEEIDREKEMRSKHPALWQLKSSDISEEFGILVVRDNEVNSKKDDRPTAHR